MKKRVLLLLTAALLQVASYAQHSPDFAEKFMTLHQSDTTLQCVTVSPKMMEQLVKLHDEDKPETIVQAISKLRSARIVRGNADHYHLAEDLLLKNSHRFKAEQTFRSEEQHGAFYTRQDKDGNTVELIMIRVEPQYDRFVIINLTGDIDKEFLCFLYNNKSFKN